MKAKIITLTPELAKQYLSKNIGNRKLKTIKNHYSRQMNQGLWKENGEPIIIDRNGFVKDGQHRLNACIEANYSYRVPLIYDVDPDVMDTIDTGANRTLGDVLDLNGFARNKEYASAVKVIIKHKRNKVASHKSGDDRKLVSNSEGLTYAKENKENIHSLIKVVDRVTNISKQKTLNKTDLYWFIYCLSEFDITKDIVDFFKGVFGGALGQESCTYYAYQKLLSATINNVKLSKIYKFNLIMKCYAIYIQNDIPVSRLNVSSKEMGSFKFVK